MDVRTHVENPYLSFVVNEAGDHSRREAMLSLNATEGRQFYEWLKSIYEPKAVDLPDALRDLLLQYDQHGRPCKIEAKRGDPVRAVTQGLGQAIEMLRRFVKQPAAALVVLGSSNSFMNADEQMARWRARGVECWIEPRTLPSQVIYEVVCDGPDPRVGRKAAG